MRFSQSELKNLREGYRLFGQQNASRGRSKSNADGWITKTLERFTFHPSRNEKSLADKWYLMNK